MEKTTKGTKKQLDKGRIFTKIMAGILALLMVVGVAGTMIFYLVAR